MSEAVISQMLSKAVDNMSIKMLNFMFVYTTLILWTTEQNKVNDDIYFIFRNVKV